MNILFYAFITSEFDRKMIENMYIEHRALMYYTAFDILKDAQKAEDAVHESFVKIISMPKKFQELSYAQTMSFCVIVSRNSAINMLKKDNRFLPSEEDLIENIKSDKYVDDEVIEKLEEESIVNLILSLPVIYKDVMYLYYTTGCKVKEIAKLLGISNEAAKKRIQRARKALMSMIYKEGLGR